MAKVPVLKVKDSLHLLDLHYADKLQNGQRVNLLLPLKKASTRKRRWKFVRGTLQWDNFRNCECCGPFRRVSVLKADGTVVLLLDEWKGQFF